MDERDLKAHTKSVQDDKHRVKLSKEYQEFAVWVAEQTEFTYSKIISKWFSTNYTPKSTIQLYMHFQKNVIK